MFELSSLQRQVWRESRCTISILSSISGASIIAVQPSAVTAKRDKVSERKFVVLKVSDHKQLRQVSARAGRARYEPRKPAASPDCAGLSKIGERLHVWPIHLPEPSIYRSPPSTGALHNCRATAPTLLHRRYCTESDLLWSTPAARPAVAQPRAAARCSSPVQ